MSLTDRDIQERLEREFPGSSLRVLDVDEVVPDRLVVVLSDLEADAAEPFLWLTVFEHASNGWFDVLSTEGDDFVQSQPMGTTIAVRSGVAPASARRCRVEALGQSREREIRTPGFFLVGFFSPGERAEQEIPRVEFS